MKEKLKTRCFPFPFLGRRFGFIPKYRSLCFRFVVHGLKTGETYVFRVQAINELGLSDESQESAPLSVRAALSTYGQLLQRPA